MNLKWNKYKIKHYYLQFKQRCKYWGYQSKEIAAQIFIPLAIFQLVRTIFFPTPFDVFLLLVIFAIILFLLIDWL
ncbi:uncharacterized membrane protein (DUF2068 family) [Caldalkalibacillus uzonensis]|uniref:Uncharacterized membrane protein (DUF2068 family) n=2 Tax=Caldalkalibacillus uzonensis TaxID=353224 RepID=A0ABU0CTR1_9BACI|nr:uncharacterized membrane protein (DUF2068 family) [Caldalkalibacillus uzonensis]